MDPEKRFRGPGHQLDLSPNISLRFINKMKQATI